MKKLMQVDLSSIATPVVTKKRVYKKRKVEEKVEERPVEGGKSLAAFPVKEKKPPSEKQLAAREKMKQARLAKIEQVKAEKARLDEEVRLKEEEITKKKKELAEKRRLKREEKKKLEPIEPAVKSLPGKTGVVEDKGPTISEALQTVGNVSENLPPVPPNSPAQFRCGNENHAVLLSLPDGSGNVSTVGKSTPANEELNTIQEEPATPTRTSVQSTNPPNAPKREYIQRFRSYPFGKPAPAAPRFR